MTIMSRIKSAINDFGWIMAGIAAFFLGLFGLAVVVLQFDTTDRFFGTDDYGNIGPKIGVIPGDHDPIIIAEGIILMVLAVTIIWLVRKNLRNRRMTPEIPVLVRRVMVERPWDDTGHATRPVPEVVPAENVPHGLKIVKGIAFPWDEATQTAKAMKEMFPDLIAGVIFRFAGHPHEESLVFTRFEDLEEATSPGWGDGYVLQFICGEEQS